MSEFPLSTLVEPTTLFIRMCVWCTPPHTYKTEYTPKTARFNHVETSTGMCEAASDRCEEASRRLLIEDLTERLRLVRLARENLNRLFS